MFICDKTMKSNHKERILNTMGALLAPFGSDDAERVMANSEYISGSASFVKETGEGKPPPPQS